MHLPSCIPLLFVFLSLIGCAQTASATFGTPRSPRPETCTLQIISPESATKSNYELVGVVTLTAPAGTNALDDSIRQRVQPRACALGGDAVSVGASANTAGLGASQSITFDVWARQSQESAPKTWGDAKAKSGPAIGKTSAAAAAPVLGPTSAAPPIASRDEPSRASSAPARDQGIPIMAALGYSSNDLAVGLGVRGGKTLANRIYVGGAVVYHFGHDVASSQVGGYTANASLSAFYIGPEVGYDFDFAPVTIRAYSGLGIVWLNASATTSGPGIPTVSSSSSANKFVLWPGATVLYPLTDSSWFLGGDLRFLTIPDGPAVQLFALAGTRL
jgi:hypothetical protein